MAVESAQLVWRVKSSRRLGCAGVDPRPRVPAKLRALLYLPTLQTSQDPARYFPRGSSSGIAAGA